MYRLFLQIRYYFVLEYNERNYEPISRFGINVDIDGNPIDVSGEKLEGTQPMLNGDGIVIVRKRNQQLFTRTHKDDDDLKKLRLDSISNKYENKILKFAIQILVLIILIK